ncbi:MAG: hypothetical protein GC168_14330 [Candidatus Hydrogenedens sp.]|nr:hypothetical protein [Candidatus Hydrogenedens sp.]
MKRAQANRRGAALVLVVLFSAAMAGFAMLIISRVQLEKRAVENYRALRQAEDAASAGLEYATAMLWDQYIASLGKALEPDLGGYTDFLKKTLNQGVTHLLEAPLELTKDALIASLDVEVKLSLDKIELLVISTGSSGGRERRFVQSLEIGGKSFQGVDYALLTNNLECIMCHTKVDNVLRVNNTDSTLYGTFDRVKIGVLESMSLERQTGEARVAGTIHSRGEAFTTDMGDSPMPYKGTALKATQGYGISADGKILEDRRGRPADSVLALGGLDALGLPLGMENLYLGYPDADEEMSDGYLPTEIPPAIPDTNANRVVDDEEWKQFVGAQSPGGIGDGIVYGVPHGNTYEEKSLPERSNGALKEVSQSGYYDGNLVLVGTEDQPIELKGDVFVNGDVMITGKVEGTGKITARRNIYFLGDTQMADGDAYGTSKEGNQNLQGYAAGGNILMGDYLTATAYPADLSDTTDERGQGYGRGDYNGRGNAYGRDDDWRRGYGNNRGDRWDRDEEPADYSNNYDPKNDKIVYTDFSQTRETKTELPYVDERTIDKSPQLDKGFSPSYTSQMMMRYNQREAAKAKADPSYVPRYYRMREGDRVYALKDGAPVHDNDRYNSKTMRQLSKSDLKGSVLLDMGPERGWMPESTLKQIWLDDELGRKPEKKKDRGFEIDGMLYTNNAMIGLAHSQKYHNSKKNGRLSIRGAITAADLGIHASGNNMKQFDTNPGLELFYDPRVQGLIGVAEEEGLTLTRGIQYIDYGDAK